MSLKLRKRILQDDELIAKLKSRGFELSPFGKSEDSNCTFIKPGVDGIHIFLHISPWEKDSFQCGIIIGSLQVTEKYYCLNLFFDQLKIPSIMPFGILAVDLHWLRWNEKPEMAQIGEIGYSLNIHDGFRDFFNDLDSVGQAFINEVSTVQKLASCLLELSAYPIKIEWGGKPRSSDPFIFSAILFIEAGDTVAARAALDRGLVEYEVPGPMVEWQLRKVTQFRRRKEILIDYICSST